MVSVVVDTATPDDPHYPGSTIIESYFIPVFGTPTDKGLMSYYHLVFRLTHESWANLIKGELHEHPGKNPDIAKMLRAWDSKYYEGKFGYVLSFISLHYEKH